MNAGPQEVLLTHAHSLFGGYHYWRQALRLTQAAGFGGCDATLTPARTLALYTPGCAHEVLGLSTNAYRKSSSLPQCPTTNWQTSFLRVLSTGCKRAGRCLAWRWSWAGVTLSAAVLGSSDTQLSVSFPIRRQLLNQSEKGCHTHVPVAFGCAVRLLEGWTVMTGQQLWVSSDSTTHLQSHDAPAPALDPMSHQHLSLWGCMETPAWCFKESLLSL